MRNLSRFVPNVHFEQIPIKNLVSNQDYQRSISKTHIERAVRDFDLYQINPVKVSRRDGVNYVFNGQHTIEIVATVSGSRDTPVWCMIYDDLSYEHEADIFANQMKHVKVLQPYEVFQANLEAGNPAQQMILSLVQSYGLKLGSTKAPNTICAVSTVESIFTKYGYHVLDRTLHLIVATWEGDTNSFSANFLNAVARIIITYGDAINELCFADRLGKLSVRQILRTAKDRNSGALGLAEVLVMEYNGKKKSENAKLNIRKLYGPPPLIPVEELSAEDYADESADAEDAAQIGDTSNMPAAVEEQAYGIAN